MVTVLLETKGRSAKQNTQRMKQIFNALVTTAHHVPTLTIPTTLHSQIST